MRKYILLMVLAVMSVAACSNQESIYDFSVQDAEGRQVSLADYKGKVLLIVNTASRCGFTPQYKELEAMYRELNRKGFEILDFPCNQFGNQAPESDAEYVAFCRANYGTEFKQFHKIDVNGENEIPLYAFLKKQQQFVGFDKSHPLCEILETNFDKNQPDWRENADIKWNFTKFLVDKKGNVVARFEPTATEEQMVPEIMKYLK